MSEMKLGANTFSYIYTHSMLESLRRLNRIGYSDFEILVAQPHFWATDFGVDERRDMPKILADEGLNIASVNIPGIDNNIVSSTREMRDFTVSVISDLIDICGDWGIGQCIIVPGRTMPLWPIPKDQLTEWFIDGMTKLADRAGDQGVTVLVENVPNTWIPRAGDVMEALDALDRDEVRVIYDLANAPFAGEDPLKGVRIVRDRLDLVHLSDTPWDAWRHDPIGMGEMDFTAYNAVLRDIGYRGLAMVELIAESPDAAFADAKTKLGGAGWT